jgi:hypothetical protein
MVHPLHRSQARSAVVVAQCLELPLMPRRVSDGACPGLRGQEGLCQAFEEGLRNTPPQSMLVR